MQKKKDSTEGGMIGDGGLRILSRVLLEGYEVMRTSLCPPLSFDYRDQTEEFEAFNLIIDD